MTTELVLYGAAVALGIVLGVMTGIPAGVVLLIGLVCWIIEKPLLRLSARLAAFAEREASRA